MSITYDFVYCMAHDDGCCIPNGTNCDPCCTNGSDICVLRTFGSLAFDGQEVRVLTPIFKNYDIAFGGGFVFSTYARNTLDSNGNVVYAHPVIDWIRAQSAMH